MFALWLFARGISLIPHGAIPSTWNQYREAINEEEKTFKCFDGSKVIKLSQINDDYRDCADGSDEPGTSLSPFGKFYCSNNGTTPTEIDIWSVGDGICDCCDGSDELFNDKANCPNTCKTVEDKRTDLMEKLKEIFIEGIKQKPALKKEGEQIKAEAAENVKRIREEIKLQEENRTKTEAEGIARKKIAKGEDPNATPTPIPTVDTTSYNTEPPLWKQFFTALWKVTFQVPERDEPHSYDNDYYDYDRYGGYHYEDPYDEDCRVMLAEIDNKLYRMRNEEEKASKLEGINEIDPAWYALFGKKYSMGEYKLDFLIELKKDWESLGRYTSTDNVTMEYTDGSYCWDIQKNKNTTLSFICSNESKLVSVEEDKDHQCQFTAVFASPIACSKDAVAELQTMTLEDLELYMKRLEVDSNEMEEEEEEDIYDGHYRDYSVYD